MNKLLFILYFCVSLTNCTITEKRLSSSSKREEIKVESLAAIEHMFEKNNTGLLSNEDQAEIVERINCIRQYNDLEWKNEAQLMLIQLNTLLKTGYHKDKHVYLYKMYLLETYFNWSVFPIIANLEMALEFIPLNDDNDKLRAELVENIVDIRTDADYSRKIINTSRNMIDVLYLYMDQYYKKNNKFPGSSNSEIVNELGLDTLLMVSGVIIRNKVFVDLWGNEINFSVNIKTSKVTREYYKIWSNGLNNINNHLNEDDIFVVESIIGTEAENVMWDYLFH